jgi:hypothetical protein
VRPEANARARSFADTLQDGFRFREFAYEEPLRGERLLSHHPTRGLALDVAYQDLVGP